jgi:tetratricopeptide (TPR) repeat protein
VGGDATFSGTNYQASVIAFVFVHVLTETKLRWLPVADDTPSAVSGEVKGPGDDARVEFVSGAAPIEIQAKHGLRPQKAIEAFRAIRDATSVADPTPVMLTVNSTSSPAVRSELRRDLDRLRSGRTDDLKDLARTLQAEFGDQASQIMLRIHVRVIDVDIPTDNEASRALELLTENLEDASKATTAWALLERDAARMCADKSRRTRRALIELLSSAGISLLPPRRTRKWHDDLRHSKNLLADDEPTTALTLLKQIESDLKTRAPDGEVLYRLNQHKSAAYLQLGKYKEASEHAQKALDHNPDGVHALVNLANAQALGNEMDEAITTAEEATTRHPQDPSAWLTRFQLSLLPGQSPIVPPLDVASTSEYRCGLVKVFLFHEDGSQARKVVASLIQEGDRSPLVLLLRVDSLLVDIDTAAVEERLSRAQEIERLCSEVLHEAADRSDRWSQRALVRRSVARRVLGRVAESQTDIENARALRPDDAHILTEAAQARIQAGRNDAALELLTGPVVDEHPFLLAMRAGLLAGRREIEKARKDLDAVLQALPDFHQPDMLRSAAAEVALALDDLALAKKLMAETSDGYSRSAHHVIVMARIAALEGHLDLSAAHYRQAAAIDPSHRIDLLAELGSRLLEAKDPTAAVQVFREAQPLPPAAERSFVRALVAVDQLADAHRILEQIASRGSMPDWAVAYAAQIAVRRNDPINAATHLEELITRGTGTADGRLMLIDTLLDLDQPDRARVYAEGLLQEEDLSPRERMALAQYLMRLGDPVAAIEVGLLAYRQAAHDAEINRAFASLVFLSKSPPVEVEQIEAGAHAILRNDENKELQYLVFAETVGQRLPIEISRVEARDAGLIGLRLGDIFTQDKGAWFEKRWRVEQLQSAVKYLVNDIVANFGTRFPSEPFFAAGFHINTNAPSISDFQPMIVSTQERGRQQERLLDVYREQCLPLGPVAKLAGVSVPDLIRELSKPDCGRPVFVEWSDRDGNVASRQAARQNRPLVVTRSSLFTADALAITDLVARSRQCVAPRSLRDEIRAELIEAEERVKDGWKVIAAGERGLIFQGLEPGHPSLVHQRDSVHALLDWADAHVEFLPRPLEAFGDPRTQNAETRSNLGESSNDSLELALHAAGVLYADDLGLRVIAKEFGASSCSTVSLIQVLAESGAVGAEERDRMLVDLVERHYNAVPVSPEILVEALAPSRTVHAAREVFSLLAAPAMDVAGSARVLVKAIKAAALKAIKTATASQMARYGLEGMFHRFSRLAATQAVILVADVELALLPSELQVVKAACVQFRKAAKI